MESNFNNENFERFLKESSDQYRMYASENVWKNIYGYLHTRRRWFGIGLILLLSAGFVTTIMLTNSSVSANPQVVDKKASQTLKSQPVDNSIEPESLIISPYSNKGTIKEKAALLQPFTITENNIPNTRVDAVAGTSAISSASSTSTLNPNISSATNKNEIAIEQPSLQNEISQNPVAFYPISVSISDQFTDEDAWTRYSGGLLNKDSRPVSNDIFKAGTSSSNPLTIESVINSYTRRNKRLSFQYYFTPTISYRKLSENKSYIRSQGSGSAIYGDINNVVTHKPDMGLEVGVNARYTLNKLIKLRAGLQFNTSRYDIKAFNYASEQTTIALNTGYSVDSIRTTSNYRNFNGYSSDWLHNFYFQISLPVGLELKLAGDDKVQFGIASTIQPTYILGDRVYLLSSNYKNYAEVPSLIRRWNMNTSFEAFVSYSTGKMNWQIGPQVRYQLHSSYVKEYPVRENLFDFGLKIGVSPNR